MSKGDCLFNYLSVACLILGGNVDAIFYKVIYVIDLKLCLVRALRSFADGTYYIFFKRKCNNCFKYFHVF